MDDVETGDIILFSNNTTTGFILKTFTCSDWNHVGIAIRVKNKKIRINKGPLYVLEINTEPRMDILTGKLEHGIGLTDFEYCKNLYNKIAVRKLNGKYKNKKLIKRTLKFIDSYRGIKFPASLKPFLSVYTGITFDEETRFKKEFFCSEITARYYTNIFCNNSTEKLPKIFGLNAPVMTVLYSPGHYSHSSTPESYIFPDKEEIIYISECSPGVVLLQPLVMCLLVAMILAFILDNCKKHCEDHCEDHCE